MRATFCIFNCPVDFNVIPYLQIPRAEFISSEREQLEKELEEVSRVLANQVNNALEQRGETATVFPLSMHIDNHNDYDPMRGLMKMCPKVGNEFEVYVGYKRQEFYDKTFYLPQIRLACIKDHYGDFTMYDILNISIDNEGRMCIRQID